MNEEIELMVRIYNTYEVDWMGDNFDDINELTRHHIVKKCDGGENGISNYALLTHKSHILLHYFEEHYNNDYQILNEMFLKLNRSLNPPSVEYYEKVKAILKRLKKRIKNQKRLSKGKK